MTAHPDHFRDLLRLSHLEGLMYAFAILDLCPDEAREVLQKRIAEIRDNPMWPDKLGEKHD